MAEHRTPSQVLTVALPQASFPTLKGFQMALSQYWGKPPPHHHHHAHTTLGQISAQARY